MEYAARSRGSMTSGRQLAAVKADDLEPRERFDRQYLLAVADRDLFWLEKAQLPTTNPYWYQGIIDPDMYLSRNYAAPDVRMKAYIKYALPSRRWSPTFRPSLKGPLPRTFVELGIADFGGMADFYSKDVAPVFASVNDPDLQKQLKDANTNARTPWAPEELPDRPARHGDRQVCAGQGPVRANGQGHGRRGHSVDQIEAAGRHDLDRKHPGAEGRVRHISAEGHGRRLRGQVMADSRRTVRWSPRGRSSWS